MYGPMLGWVAWLLPLPLSLMLAWLRPAWQPSRSAAIAAAIVPVLNLLPALRMVAAGVMTPQSHCGTDTCGMIIAVGMMIGMASGAMFLFGWALARAILWLVAKAAPKDREGM